MCFSSSLVCVFESPECGQVCHIAALGAWVCGDVSAQMCVLRKACCLLKRVEEDEVRQKIRPSPILCQQKS